MTERTNSLPAGPEGGWREYLPTLAVVLSMTAIFTAVLGVVLAAADDIGLSRAETTGWIIAGYGIPGLVGLALTLRYRIPLLLTGNVFIFIFIGTLGRDFSWGELVGSTMLAGAIVLIMAALGLTDLLARWLPAPIVFGLLAGAVLTFVVEMFAEMTDFPLLIGLTIIAYLLARVLTEPRVPAILPAIVTAFLVAGLSGDLEPVPVGDASLLPVLTAPELSLGAILTVVPVTVVLITVQANIPSLVFLEQEGYEPPGGLVNVLSGLGTVGSSVLGAVGMSLSLPATAYSAGPDAGPPARRYRSVIGSSVVLILFGVLAGLATLLAEAVPHALLITVAGLAILGVLAQALGSAVGGELTWGPLFAFAISLSDLRLLGFGSFFWAIVGGTAVSLLVERPAMRRLREAS